MFESYDKVADSKIADLDYHTDVRRLITAKYPVDPDSEDEKSEEKSGKRRKKSDDDSQDEEEKEDSDIFSIVSSKKGLLVKHNSKLKEKQVK